jgi:hypothetical protein
VFRLGRHVRTDFLYNPSTGSSHSFITTSFDELGRKTAEADQLGLTTSFHYDPLGRLTAVEQPPVDDPEDAAQRWSGRATSTSTTCRATCWSSAMPRAARPPSPTTTKAGGSAARCLR